MAAQRSAHRKEVAPTVAGDDAVLEPALRRQGQARSTIGWRGKPELDLIVTLDDRHQRDLLGLSGRGGRDSFELQGIE